MGLNRIRGGPMRLASTGSEQQRARGSSHDGGIAALERKQRATSVEDSSCRPLVDDVVIERSPPYEKDETAACIMAETAPDLPSSSWFLPVSRGPRPSEYAAPRGRAPIRTTKRKPVEQYLCNRDTTRKMFSEVFDGDLRWWARRVVTSDLAGLADLARW